MSSVNIWKGLTATAVSIAALSLLFIVMGWIGFWKQGEYEFAFSILTGLMLLLLINLFIAALCWRLHQLEVTINKLRTEQIEFSVKENQQGIASIEPIDEIIFVEQHAIDNGDDKHTQTSKSYILSIHKDKVYRGNQYVKLAPKEFLLIELLIGNDGLCSNEDIIANVWSEEVIGMNRTNQDINQLIRRLRRKINVDGHDYIYSHPGRGYEFRQWNEL